MSLSLQDFKVIFVVVVVVSVVDVVFRSSRSLQCV